MTPTMVKTRNIPERTTKTRMQSELHRDLRAVRGRGHVRVFGEDLALDSPQPSPPDTPASFLSPLPRPSSTLGPSLFLIYRLFLFSLSLLLGVFWLASLLDSSVCILSGGGEWEENSRGQSVERAGVGLKSASVCMCLAVLASTISGKTDWVSSSLEPHRGR